MGRNRVSESLPTDPVVRSLLNLALAHGGGHNPEVLARQRPLLQLPAVHHRKARGASNLEALLKAIDDVASSGYLTSSELQAVSVLLGLVPTSQTSDGVVHRVTGRSHHQRLEIATQHFGHMSSAHFTRARKDSSGMWHPSPEVRLLTRFKDALEALDAAAGVTRHLTATSQPSLSIPASPTHDLVGTWVGEAVSDWHVDTAPQHPSTNARCFMTVESIPQGQLKIRWLNSSSVFLLISSRLTAANDGRRLICVYEAWPIEKEDSDPPYPSHRGACVLDIQGLPANHIEGAYWTDRRTEGQLRFDRRIERVADTFAEAQLLLDSGAARSTDKP